MNQLFEAFLTNFIQRHRQEILPQSLQNCELLPQGKQTSMYMARYHGQPVFRLKPDLVFRQGKHYPLLIDFKYKILNPQDRKLGISEADFYQMNAYLSRFKCSKVILIYPQTFDVTQPIRSSFILEGISGQVQAISVNLIQDLTKQDTTKNLISELQNILEIDHE